MFMKIALALTTAVSLTACGSNPGGFTAELQPVNVAGHDIRTVTASAWMKTCFGNPDQVSTMLSQFEHLPNGQLKHLASGVTMSEGDCNALIKALGLVAAAKIGAQDITTNATAVTSTNVDIKIN